MENINQLELYVNKKFDILKIIKMVLKRKGWGETYTLYSTPTHEVLIVMQSYDFEDKYATFKIKINEKNGSGYYSNTLKIYTDREDYTLKFINKLLLKVIKSYLFNYRRSIFESEASELYPYVWESDKSDEEWIEEFGLQEKVNKINQLDINDDEKEELIETLISKQFSKYKDRVCYEPRNKYLQNALESNKEKPILDLIEEIEKELEEIYE